MTDKRFLILSDLHLEGGRLPDLDCALDYVIPDADFMIVPGDLHHAPRIYDALKPVIGDSQKIPVIFVPGNHEHYRQDMPVAREQMRLMSSPLLHVLDPGVVVFPGPRPGDGTRFIGATLWTDYALYSDPSVAMEEARNRINDHRQFIRNGKDSRGHTRYWSPKDALARHREELAFIEAELAVPFDGRTVVVTHHAPSPLSIHPRHQQTDYDRAINPAFASDLTWLIERYQPDLWVHGHVHDSVDYMIGNTRVFANPRGYERGYGEDAENKAYSPGCVLRLERKALLDEDEEAGFKP